MTRTRAAPALAAVTMIVTCLPGPAGALAPSDAARPHGCVRSPIPARGLGS
ncbi:hypothetical protein [Kitasatospora sp. MBT63]|uniref:hypothetical protein n=1 Tax=Kitasatospora sp. MBT63 TaxID=1444768 RepID=UPI001314914B|nr:hypothetical protein [Kitasatospora sp. MBT63]